MKTLMQWLKLHPIKAVIFTMIFTAIATSAAFREDLTVKLVGTYAFFLGLWCLTFTLDMRKVMVLLLAAAFSYSPCRAAEPPQHPKAAAIAVGVVVICVGGYCVYKLVKVCQKVFPPKDTNAPPSELTAGGSTGEYGGAYEYSSIGSCYVPPDFTALGLAEDPANPTTFTLNVALQSGEIRTSMKAENSNAGSQTWTEFQSDMAEHGLFLTGRGAYQAQYELDGVPCDAAMVPLSFEPLTGMVTHNTGGELRRIVIERSPDMQEWSAFLSTTVSDGTGFKVIDTTREGQMFYRVSLQ